MDVALQLGDEAAQAETLAQLLDVIGSLFLPFFGLDLLFLLLDVIGFFFLLFLDLSFISSVRSDRFFISATFGFVFHFFC